MARKRAADPELYRQRAAEWNENNREKSAAKSLAYRQRHPERVKAYAQAFQKRNVKRWYDNNGPGVDRARARARLRATLHKDARMDPVVVTWTQIIDADPCAYCGARSDTWDHIIPVTLGGDSDWTNLVGACRSCNASKNNKPLLMFLIKRGEDRRVYESARPPWMAIDAK